MSGPGDAQESERNSLRDRNRELATLLEVSRRLASTLQLDEILQAATDGVTRLHALKTAAIYLGEGDVLRLSATTPPLPPQSPDDLRLIALADHPYLREAIESGAPTFLEDAASAPHRGRGGRHDLQGLRSILFLPLTAGVRCVGALIVGSVDGPVALSPPRSTPAAPSRTSRPWPSRTRSSTRRASVTPRTSSGGSPSGRGPSGPCGRARRGCGSPSWRRSRASTTSTSRPARPS